MEVVRQNWLADITGDPLLMFKHKLKRVKIALSKWSKLTYEDIFKQIALREDVARVKEMLFEEEPTVENRIVLQKAQSELKRYLIIDEQYWKEKAAMSWFVEGDRNTRFSHKHVNGKRQKLQLKRIQNHDGTWIVSQDQLADAAVEFYQKQFTQEDDSTCSKLLSNVPPMVSSDQNIELCRISTIEEVKAIIFALSGESAGGPDGFTGIFFQESWDIIGEEYMRC
nr:uncharacterized protein LOC104100838 [Nicotiana tomentosiformis]